MGRERERERTPSGAMKRRASICVCSTSPPLRSRFVLLNGALRPVIGAPGTPTHASAHNPEAPQSTRHHRPPFLTAVPCSTLEGARMKDGRHYSRLSRVCNVPKTAAGAGGNGNAQRRRPRNAVPGASYCSSPAVTQKSGAEFYSSRVARDAARYWCVVASARRREGMVILNSHARGSCLRLVCGFLLPKERWRYLILYASLQFFRSSTGGSPSPCLFVFAESTRLDGGWGREARLPVCLCFQASPLNEVVIGLLAPRLARIRRCL